jgi:predicted alpha/beta superfamily hydrolase
VRKGQAFSGNGRETLDFISSRLIPEVHSRYGVSGLPQDTAIAGYSLAGLMALWSLYETDAFGLCGCCSGSLWYEGFMDYMAERSPQNPARVYLSLGKKEERTKNPVMANIGDATRAAAELLSQNPNVSGCMLDWQEGGHFSDVPLRLAKALLWLFNDQASGNG